MMARTILACGDWHVPKHNEAAIAAFQAVAKHVKPDLIVGLGDLLDCAQFSRHAPTFGELDTDYQDDLNYTNGVLDNLQSCCNRLVLVEGNHEYRIDSYAADKTEGRGTYTMIAPRIQLSRGRSNFTYIPYGSVTGKYPHYKVNNRIVAVHGWSYAKNASRRHLDMSQGKSIIYGHSHRVDTLIVQNVWRKGDHVQARGAGCLCNPIPTYGVGRPVEWVNAFIIGFLGKHSDTLYTVPIRDGVCVLPSGKEICG